MGIVRGADGKLYKIPDEDLQRYAVAPEKEKEKVPETKPAPAVRRRGSPVVIQIFTAAPRQDPSVVAQSAWGGWGSPAPRRAGYRMVQEFVVWS